MDGPVKDMLAGMSCSSPSQGCLEQGSAGGPAGTTKGSSSGASTAPRSLFLGSALSPGGLGRVRAWLGVTWGSSVTVVPPFLSLQQIWASASSRRAVMYLLLAMLGGDRGGNKGVTGTVTARDRHQSQSPQAAQASTENPSLLSIQLQHDASNLSSHMTQTLKHKQVILSHVLK